MTIYVSHPTSYDYKSELYIPLRSSPLNKKHTIILPHETSNIPYEVRQLFESKKCDLVIAECSYPSTGQGIELGYADMLHIPIICIYKQGNKISGSLKTITDTFLTYQNTDEMIKKIEVCINHV